jgi:hypothetical protein
MQISFLRFDARNMTAKVGTLSDSREQLNIVNKRSLRNYLATDIPPR